MTYVNTHENEADLLTKQLPSGEKRKSFVRNSIAPHLSIIKVCWQFDGEDYAMGRTSQCVCVGGLVEQP